MLKQNLFGWSQGLASAFPDIRVAPIMKYDTSKSSYRLYLMIICYTVCLRCTWAANSPAQVDTPMNRCLLRAVKCGP